MTDTLLWSLDETARQLGGISTRTVRRMIESGELEAVRIRRTVKVVADSVRAMINQPDSRPAKKAVPVHTLKPGGKAWHSNAKTRRSGGSLSQIKAASELNALLAPAIAKKPKR